MHFHDGQPVLPAATVERSAQLALKRAIDIGVSALALVALSPFLLGLAAAIKLTSRGPVLFKQERAGRDNKPISVLKFRTMHVEHTDAAGTNQTVEADPRITGIGRFMRKASLDELPQLINVLFGSMSLVGPRPHVFVQQAGGVPYEMLVPYYLKRYAMTPGVTGWAQANGLRGPTTDTIKARKRIDHDLAYIQNFSLWLDFKIVLLTIKNELAAGGSGH